MHGGTPAAYPCLHISSGLSPRARGNQGEGGVGRNVPRSIPACTGEPDVVTPSDVVTPVYPRVHGGTAYHPSARRVGRGLSPRARGNPTNAKQSTRSQGSIPACTGEPNKARLDATEVAVYPRVHGGTTYTAAGLIYAWGLSPRARGNLLCGNSRSIPTGSIPACTGEPYAM